MAEAVELGDQLHTGVAAGLGEPAHVVAVQRALLGQFGMRAELEAVIQFHHQRINASLRQHLADETLAQRQVAAVVRPHDVQSPDRHIGSALRREGGLDREGEAKHHDRRLDH